MKHEQSTETKQLLHLVFGGELTDLEGVEFADLEKLDIVGIFPDYEKAYNAWKSEAQRTVDNAHMRYFIAHIHRLRDEEAAASSTEVTPPGLDGTMGTPASLMIVLARILSPASSRACG